MSRSEEPGHGFVAFCGTRGVPATYGGFETAVDQISRRLVESGLACEVFCRLSSSEKARAEHDGRALRYVQGSKRRTLDTFVASIETGWQLLRERKRYRHVFWFNNANLPGILLTRLAGIPMSVNTDGLEWRRAKWRWPFKAYYFASSFVIARVCPTLISDSIAIQDHYAKTFRKQTTFIPYGVTQVTPVSRDREREILDRWDLVSGRYLLQITRVEPDNLPLDVVEGFAASSLPAAGFKMVSVGYKDPTPYAQRLLGHNGHDGVVVHPAVYDAEVLQVLRTNCYAYVHGNSVGGTNPALLEAMTTCPRVIAIDCEFSREVLGDTGTFFSRSSLATDLDGLVMTSERGPNMKQRVLRHYQWDAVAACYARLVDADPVRYAALLEDVV